MAIQSRNKRDVGFNSSSMSDLVFLLLIFFMITSTLIAPNAVKLLLPNSSSKTLAKQNVIVYIDENLNYLMDVTGDGTTQVVDTVMMRTSLINQLGAQENDGTIVLRADKSVPIQYVVSLFDVVNGINTSYNKQYKVILATKPK